ncbi:MAG: DNA-binding NarL/FixJ family response regulator [Saprospiraceae bacterium]|jgi:DNA-binding NarL/FixJ family response regulator
MIRILLVDDHKLVRDGIRAQLVHNPKFQIIAEASDGQEALDILEDKVADLVIMDITMDGMDGITCTKQVIKLYPDIKVLALTMLSENQHIKQMLKAGASGYLLKNCEEEELKKAIETIHSGGTYYSPEVTRIIMTNLSGQKVAKNTTTQIPLTTREKEVLRLILEENSNKEIADQLFISQRTVDAHKRNLLEKTGAKNVAGLVLFAVNNQIFEDF